MTEFLAIGESLFDIIVGPDSTVEHVGGSPLNVAVGLARQGFRVRFATYFGADSRGQQLLDFFARESIEVVSGSQAAAATSIAKATLDATGAASYEFSFASALPAGLEATGHLHAGSISATTAPGAQQILAFLTAHRDEWTVSYDPNVRPSLMGTPDAARPHIEALIAVADVVKSSDEDAAWLYPDLTLTEVIAHWRQLGPAIVVITRGGAGALYAAGDVVESIAAPPTTVVDTVGAGDSFMAGLLGGLARDGLVGASDVRDRYVGLTASDLKPAVTNALARAAAVVSRAGAEGSHIRG